jgi:hypothetical protein
VNLPEVEVVGLKTTQRLLEHPHGERTVAAVSADLGHALMVDSKPVCTLQVCQRQWGAISRARHHIARKEVPNANVNDKRPVINVFGRGIKAAANAVV